jgi:predicted PhzF superfamily epimerase YddE/YHI9
VRPTGDGLAFAAPPLVRSGPVDDAVVAHIADVLGIAVSEIVDAQWADNGPGWVAVLLADAAAGPAPHPAAPAGCTSPATTGRSGSPAAPSPA